MTPTNDRVVPFVARSFLDEATCAACCDAMRQGMADAATIACPSGQSLVNTAVRQTSSVRVAREVRRVMRSRLEALMPSLARHFETELTALQEAEFLLYKRGDFFRPHQDNSTEDAHSPELRGREVSAVLFLNRRVRLPAEGGYCGGELRLYTPRDPSGPFIQISGEPGLLVAFQSAVLHEVRPVSHGDRYTVAVWYTGAQLG